MNDKLLTKIRNLLARADKSKNDNEHEREIALRQAESLMAKHAISHLDLSDAEQRYAIGDLTDTRVARVKRDVWPVCIMSTLSPLYRCRVVKLHGNQLHLFGHRTNIDILTSITDYYVRSVRREMITAYDKQLGFKPNRRRFNTSFGYGASAGVKHQVTELIAARDRGDIPEMEQSKAMMVVDQYKQQLQKVNGHLQTVYPTLRKRKRSITPDAAGYSSGKNYGKAIQLGGQLGGKAPVGRLR